MDTYILLREILAVLYGKHCEKTLLKIYGEENII